MTSEHGHTSSGGSDGHSCPRDDALREEDQAQRQLLLEAFGQRLRRLRIERELSQEELAGRSGLSRKLISRLEHGRSSPNLATIACLAKGLGADVVPLVDGLPHIKVSSPADDAPQP